MARTPDRIHPTCALAAGSLAALCACAAPQKPASEPYLPYELASAREPEEPLAPSAPPPSTNPLESALAELVVNRQWARRQQPRGSAFPESHRAAWATALAAVDAFLATPGPTTRVLELVRARVVLEAELDLDRMHYASLPSGLEASVQARTLALRERLQRARNLEPAIEVRFEPTSDLRWPLEPVVLTSLFGYRIDPFTRQYRNHLGVDLAARPGQPVVAAQAGRVVRAGRLGGHGLMVEIAHPHRQRTRYSHLSRILVSVGQRVEQGRLIGLAGSTGRSTGPHLHFEHWRDGEPMDPLAELIDPEFLQMTGSGGE